jgi:uncharacterized protein YqhQ
MSSFLRSGSDPAETPNPTNVGGQAVLEGVMMRAPGALSIACRRRDGRIMLRERSVPAAPPGMFRLPFLRGVHTLVASLRLGHQALTWSAELLEEDLASEETKSAPPPSPVALLALAVASPLLHLGDEASQPPSSDAPSDSDSSASVEKPTSEVVRVAEPKPAKESSAAGGLLMLVPLVFAIFLFIALPQLVAEGLNAWLGLGLDVTAPGFQAMTGASKLVIVVSYLSLIRLMPDIRRVFQYHGAEHKAISTYEKGLPLVLENARPTTALHARCGTTFIIMVAFVSVILFSIAGAFLPPIPGSRAVQSLAFFLLKLPLFPVIAGFTFELQRVFARYCTTGPLQVLLWPGFLVQKITTAEPDDAQLEVALASLRSALARAPERLSEAHPDREFASYGALVDDPAYRLAS